MDLVTFTEDILNGKLHFLRDGGLRIPIQEECASVRYESLKAIIAPLVAVMIDQGDVLPDKTLVTDTKS